jgi:uncharacterized YigZ family protein
LKTLLSLSEGYYEEKGSKFIGHAYPVGSKEEITAILEGLKRKHPKAVHVCYAYCLDKETLEIRSNDDGEPNNSAGPPILKQIQHYELSNVLVAVVRYYGGVNLGVGGLMKAYKAAAKDALKASQIIEKEAFIELKVEIENAQFSSFMHYVHQRNIPILEQGYTTKHFVKIQLSLHAKAEFLQKFQPFDGITTL